ncbi:sulfite reductase subunit alpha [Opitutus terrae]|uniref:assimilatory sulfite reductase (NADPH) n=1 Tax=Opitutus terrae (strain DSM 11246 / JCM 15787 / PB90-1) TaxID=452637 RepID=B1ZYG7_OPITP|nr:sulfite reductase subunit alpha [Opitutus terrae]ACB77065.1 FAD-binding domain protein [Opitutus terrae PB90-1]
MSTVASPASTYSKDQPFPALVTENRLLTKPGSAKETRHFVVSLAGSGLHYKPGDSLAVYPTNPEPEVDAILRALGAYGDELVSPVMLRSPHPLPLRDVLMNRLALAGPSGKFVAALAERATDPAEKAKLAGLLAPESQPLLAGFLEARHFIDLIEEFPSARLTAQEFVDHLRRLQPRLYSIASSPRVTPTDVHLTVAVVRYETNERKRLGVCSTYLSDRVAVGSTVPVFVSHSHFAPPEDLSRDAIMIGPGTGIAPFRAFVQDRVAACAAGRNWVFFGDQRRATDFLYEEEWLDYVRAGQVRFESAFSRDQAQKIYVQDRMREHAAELWTWIKQGAHFYVCGDAKRMAKDVDVALHDIVAQQGGMDPAAAIDYVKQMKKEKRYQRDVY